uniref:MADF domain-containing protein n=1 Tax=Scylla olivacea TaxID=85551 RepID=A0A0P4W354_SCYOL
MADYHNTEELISEVGKRPVLWDPTTEEYKNRNKKADAWIEVCRSIYLDYEEKSAEEKKQIGKELQIRWKRIRDAYVRNSRKLKDESKSGSGAVKTHRYIFAEQLSFLRNVGENRETTDTFVPTHETEDGAEDACQNLSATQQNPSAKSKKKKSNLLEKLIKFMDGYEEKEDDDKDFFMSMLPSVRTLNSEQKIEFRMEVLAALKNIRSGHRGHTRVQDSHPLPLVLPPVQSQYPHYAQYPSSAMTHPHFFGPSAATNIHPHTVNTQENRAQVQPVAPSPANLSVPSPASNTSNTDNSVISLSDFDI